MSIGIFGSLHIAKEGLFTQQAAVSVTSHNITNVNTPGYSRQKPVITTLGSQIIGGTYFGRGSHLDTITKSYDQFLNNNIVLETSILGTWEARETYMKQLETIFNESSEIGLNAKLNEFWNAWEDLANHPEGIPERAILQSMGQSLGTTFKNMVAQLENIRSDANNRIVSTVASINQLAAEIAQLNDQILGTEGQRANANDLTDQRSLKIEELAKLIDVKVIEDTDGQLTVITSFGRPLVSENISWQLAAVAEYERDNLYAIKYIDAEDTIDITDKIASGTLKGSIEMRDTTVPDYIGKLNKLAASLIIEVNRIHYQGYGLDGTTENYFFNPGNLSASASAENQGSARIYDATIEDPTSLVVGDFTVRFASGAPVISRYEVYDQSNGQYIYHIDAGNAALVFDDSGAAGTTSIISLSHGTYTGSGLAAELEQQLEDGSSSSQDYTVTYSNADRTFTITNNGTESLEIQWNNVQSNAGSMLGFTGTTTIASNTSAISDNDAGSYIYGDNLFEIAAGVNDEIGFDDGSGGNILATITEGVYTGAEMAAALENALDGAGGGGFDVSVIYDRAKTHFQISVNGTSGGDVSFFWSDAGSTAAAILGFEDEDTNGLAAGDYDESDGNAGNYRKYERYFDISSSECTITYEDGGVGDGTGGNYVTAVLHEGRYTGEELAAEIERQLETSSGSSQQDYMVQFDVLHGTFTIINAANNVHDITIDWATSTAATTLGFAAGVETLAVYPDAAAIATSDNTVGRFAEYKKIDLFGMSARIAEGQSEPESNDTFAISTVKDAARLISMDMVTATDPQKIAAAQNTIDIDGTNNVILFDDAPIEVAANYYRSSAPNGRIEIPSGRYRPDELAAEIERQLEHNGSRVFDIRAGINDELDFDDGTAATAILTPGYYNGETLAAEIENQLEAASSEGSQFTVTFDSQTQRFDITYDSTVTGGQLDLMWSTSTVSALAGFDAIDTTNIAIGGFDRSDVQASGQGRSYAVRYDSDTHTFRIVSNPSNVNPVYLFWDNPDTNAAFTLGYNEKVFEITEGSNDIIEFDEGGTTLSITIPELGYSGEDLAEVIEDLLNEAGSQEYTVTYDPSPRGFTILNNGTSNMTLHWASAGSQQAALSLGFVPALGNQTIVADGGSTTSFFTPGGLYPGLFEAASDFEADGAQVGDNRNALVFANLKNMAVIEDRSLTMDTYYSVMVAEVGSDVDNTSRGLSHQTFMIEQFEQRRQSIAGVSLDEELINLMKYQQAYAATAKLINVIDGMLDVLVSMKAP